MALAAGIALGAAAGPSAKAVEAGDTEAVKQALRQAKPGDRIVLPGGVYPGGMFARNVNGQPGKPVVVAAKDPANPPVFRGSDYGFVLESCSHVVLDGLVFEKARVNNLQMFRCRNMVIKDCVSRDIAVQSNCDGIKLTAVRDFLIIGCTVSRWGGEGSAVDMVSCAGGLIMNCRFTYPDLSGQTANTVQPKCGSTGIGVYRCRFDDSSLRAVQFGGGIGPGRENRYDYFGKLKEEGYSGVDMAAMGNVIVGGGAAAVYASSARCAFEYNTIVDPTRYVLRILFEGGDRPTADNRFAGNLIVYGKVIQVANVGGQTKPETFAFADNYWFNRLDPARSVPKLPGPQTAPAGGTDPKLDKDHRPDPKGPAAGYGAHAPGLAEAWKKHTDKFKWAWEASKAFPNSNFQLPIEKRREPAEHPATTRPVSQLEIGNRKLEIVRRSGPQ
ncbi:MAG TPA: right-handed parallel beta-helix repeat-containing protein [Phycisphaerae bacterium]|nr:right-handed parallel beta-helix repeat-containing protein [Phycisphaerae bacterium]